MFLKIIKKNKILKKAIFNNQIPPGLKSLLAFGFISHFLLLINCIGPDGYQTCRALVFINPNTASTTTTISPNS